MSSAVLTSNRDWVDPDLSYVFLHLPKTGGTSLKRVIRDRVDPKWICPEERTNDFRIWPREQIEQYIVFFGHSNWDNLQYIPSPKKIFTIVREPITRCFSQYKYICSVSWSYIEGRAMAQHRLMKTHPLEKLLDGTYPEGKNLISNLMTKQLGYEEGRNYRVNPIDRSTVELAIERIDQLDFVGLYEDFDYCVGQVLELLGLSQTENVAKENVTADNHMQGPTMFESVDFSTLSAVQMELLHEANRFDIDLYHHCRKRFENKFRATRALRLQHANAGRVTLGHPTQISVGQGEIGWVLGGPYLGLPAGRYSVTFDVSIHDATEDTCVTLDVVGHDHLSPVAVSHVRRSENVVQWYTERVKLEFSFDVAQWNVQFRAYGHGKSAFFIKSIVELRQIDGWTPSVRA